MIPGGQALYGPKKNQTTGSIWDQMKNLPLQARINAAATQAGKAVNSSISRPSAPIVDADVRRAQLAAGFGTQGMPALDPVNTSSGSSTQSNTGSTSSSSATTRPSSNSKAPSAKPSTQSSGDVFAPSTEEELANERLRRVMSNRLARAAAEAQSGIDRLNANALAEFNAAQRGVFSDALNYRRSLSGTGLGRSPRFTTAVRQAMQARANAEQAARDRANAESVFSILSGLRGVRDDASERLSDAELDMLTTVSGRNLNNVSASEIANFFSKKAREEGDK